MSVQKQIESIVRLLVDLNRVCEEQTVLEEQISQAVTTALAQENPLLEEKKRKYYHLLNSIQAVMRSAVGYAGENAQVTDVLPKPCDWTKLLIMQSNLNRSGMSDEERTVLAGKVLKEAQAYFNYTQQEIEALIAEEEEERKKNAEQLKKKQEYGRKRIQEDAARIKKQLSKSGIKGAYREINNEFSSMVIGQSSWGKAVGGLETLLFGYKSLPVDVPEIVSKALEEEFEQRYNSKQRTVDYPFGLIPRGGTYLDVEYTGRNEVQMKMGIQALIMNILRYYPLGQYRISIADSVHYNADLIGKLSGAIKAKNAIIETVPENDKGIKDYLSLLADQYKRIHERIGTQSIEDYNSQVEAENTIPMRVLIVNGNKTLDSSFERENLTYLLNNAAAFGIFPIILKKNNKGGMYGTDEAKKLAKKTPGQIRIISDNEGAFYIEGEDGEAERWQRFVWLSAPEVSFEYVKWIREAIQEKKTETSFYKLYFTDENGKLKKKLPERSRGGRRRIDLPFAVDEEGNFQSCEFEDDQFAAYMMGASGSGKSTLLHTLISSLITNYHPDELELWLADYKMTEFSLYIKNCPPHVKYVLLENSEDLTFDIIDKLTDVLNRRKFIFAKNGWSKLTDVPEDVYMPAIFVIIDEFSIMSQIINETKGCVPDYTLKLQNLLAQGRALGMKFLFASQTYSGGVSGLTETARKQIQMRIALKNTPDEIKDTLVLASDDITATLRRDILSLPKYESLFKFRNADGELQVGRLKNMYLKMNELKKLIHMLNERMKPGDQYNPTDPESYVDKHPVLIDGGTPKTWDEQESLYRECDLENTDKFPGDLGIYPGVPCSFQLTDHFMLCEQFDENILLVGGNAGQQVSVLLSMMKSFKNSARNNEEKAEVTILAHQRDRVLRRYRNELQGDSKVLTNVDEIGQLLIDVKAEVEKIRSEAADEKQRRLIVILGYENIVNEMDRLAEMRIEDPVFTSKLEERPEYASVEAFDEYLDKLKVELDKDTYMERAMQAYEEFNAYGAEMAREKEDNKINLKIAKEELLWLLNTASQYGVHFCLLFNTARDFLKLRLGIQKFRHKLMFTIPKDHAYELVGSKQASTIAEDVLMYQGDTHIYTMRPQLHPNVPVNGWSIDEHGQAAQQELA